MWDIWEKILTLARVWKEVTFKRKNRFHSEQGWKRTFIDIVAYIELFGDITYDRPWVAANLVGRWSKKIWEMKYYLGIRLIAGSDWGRKNMNGKA